MADTEWIQWVASTQRTPGRGATGRGQGGKGGQALRVWRRCTRKWYRKVRRDRERMAGFLEERFQCDSGWRC